MRTPEPAPPAGGPPRISEEAGGISPSLEDERLVMAAARALFVNGQDTSGVLAAAERTSAAMGRRMQVAPEWDEIRLVEDGRVLLSAPAKPWAVNMRRVAAVCDLVERAPSSPADKASWRAELERAAALPGYGVALFTLACAFGTYALTYLNGARLPVTAAVAAAAAAGGALLRRGLGAWGANGLAQLFAATLLAGAVGGAASRFGLVEFASGLVALGPLFVLVPGPALMGGAMDCAALRLSMGLARLAFGLLCITVMCAGVLIGAGLAGGVTPDPQVPVGGSPLWLDMLCAAAASAAYAVFFSMPWRMMLLPVVMGALAHGLRWVALDVWGWSNAAAAGLACLLVGAVVGPVGRRWRLPFAAVGFASVVAQVPGAFLFRMSGGLAEVMRLGGAAPVALLARIAADGGTAVLTLVAMALGLTIPKALTMKLGGSAHAP